MSGTLVAAVTPVGGYRHYPPYLNVSRNINEHNLVTVTLRGDENGTACGASVVGTFTRAEFALFLLDAAKNLTP